MGSSIAGKIAVKASIYIGQPDLVMTVPLFKIVYNPFAVRAPFRVITFMRSALGDLLYLFGCQVKYENISRRSASLLLSYIIG